MSCGVETTDALVPSDCSCCCVNFNCAGDPNPTTMAVIVSTAGSCPQAQGSGVWSGIVTKDDPAKSCPDTPCDSPLWCGCSYSWQIDPGDIPTCGPYIYSLNIACSSNNPLTTGELNCTHLSHGKCFWTAFFFLARAEGSPQSLEDCPISIGHPHRKIVQNPFPDCGNRTCVDCDPGIPGDCDPVCDPSCNPQCYEPCPGIDLANFPYCFGTTTDPACYTISLCDEPGNPLCGPILAECGACIVGDIGIAPYRTYTMALGTCPVGDEITGCRPEGGCDPDRDLNIGDFSATLTQVPLYDAGPPPTLIGFSSCPSSDYVHIGCVPSMMERQSHLATMVDPAARAGVAAGSVPADGIAIAPRRFKLCGHYGETRPDCDKCHQEATNPAYREAIDLLITKGGGFASSKSVSAPMPPKSGIGDALEAIIKEAGGQAGIGCGCGSLKSKLNNSTVETVEKNLTHFADELRKNAVKLGYADLITELEAQARDMSGDPTLNIYEFIIRQAIEVEAIRRAEAVAEAIRRAEAEAPCPT